MRVPGGGLWFGLLVSDRHISANRPFGWDTELADIPMTIRMLWRLDLFWSFVMGASSFRGGGCPCGLITRHTSSGGRTLLPFIFIFLKTAGNRRKGPEIAGTSGVPMPALPVRLAPVRWYLFS